MSSCGGPQDGHEIRRLRKKRGIGRTQLADQVGIRPESLTGIENGRKPASLDVLTRIAAELDVRLLYIVKPGTALHTALTNGNGGDAS